MLFNEYYGPCYQNHWCMCRIIFGAMQFGFAYRNDDADGKHPHLRSDHGLQYFSQIHASLFLLDRRPGQNQDRWPTTAGLAKRLILANQPLSCRALALAGLASCRTARLPDQFRLSTAAHPQLAMRPHLVRQTPLLTRGAGR